MIRVKTRSQLAIILISYNGVHITRSIIGRLRYLVEPGLMAGGRQTKCKKPTI